MLSNQMSHCW